MYASILSPKASISHTLAPGTKKAYLHLSPSSRTPF